MAVRLVGVAVEQLQLPTVARVVGWRDAAAGGVPVVPRRDRVQTRAGVVAEAGVILLADRPISDVESTALTDT